MSPYFIKTAEGLAFFCPGCREYHRINFNWVVSGTDSEPNVFPDINFPMKCHLRLDKGILHYHSDSRHKFAGRDLPMIKIEEVQRWLTKNE